MRNIITLCILLTIFIILSGFFYSLTPLAFDPLYITFVLFVVFISTVIYSLRKKPSAIKKNYFTISFIFLVSFLIVHFQMYLDYSLSLISDLSLSYYLDYNIVPKAITIAALALVSYFIGGLLSTLKPIKTNLKSSTNNKVYSLLFLKVLVVIFFILFVYVTPLDFYQRGEQVVSYLQYKSNHFFQVSLWSYIIANVINITNQGNNISFIKYLKTFSIPILLIILVYFIINIIAGDRGPLINISILILSGFIVSQNRKFNLKRVLLIIIIGGSFLQFVSFLRETDNNLSLNQRIESALVLKEDISSRGESSVLPLTTELASSVRAYHAVVMDQENNEILYGTSNIGYLIGIIPGLGLLIGSITSIDLNSSAAYITDIMGADHGMGTTVLADLYLNYGITGSLIFFTFFGYFFARLDLNAYSNFRDSSLLMKVLFFIYLSYALYLGRSTFVIVLGDVFLVYILIKISLRKL